ncbi:glycosyltransferase family 39 protein [Patescibacteria group bacterium]|nr:glycosyltransferase family 39 protein [Patescibacteria group bacterium]MBU0777356.1 glycosyltransferase family 39 protein [Patescibacteria group bacterium]MBU0845984.1 glycosyltransferase family 39 protein [Patescibacteria group bacterium]MBU0922532.1 glycosyltransferase family 39 protein [Patescibacteria group bacterium]MBU1066535.1 glycosyltransferase family 39 protein [Patescibacteria group bacterium]
MKKLLNKKNIIFVILLLASVLRLWNLGSTPPHLAPDEASLGYNAYSILKTGKDEYGKIMPIIFKSFGDFKPGLYVYLTVPAVAVLGLTEFAVRLPSAAFGILAVFLMYMIGLQFFKDKKIALVSSFLLAINPWHIHFSRGAWEINVSLTLTLLGIYFFVKAIEKQKHLFYSAFFFALTLITYQGAKLSTAIVLVVLGIIYFKDVIKFEKKTLATAFLIGLLVSLPILLGFFQGKTGRLEVFSVFSYPRPTDYIQQFLDQGEEKIGGLSYYLFHSEGVNFTRGVLGRWFNHFTGRFLFFEGDWQNPRHSAPYTGMFIFTDLLLIISGFIVLVRSRSKESIFIFLWLLLAPLPAALSRDQVHAVRSYNMVIPLVLMSSFGLLFLFNKIVKHKKIILGGLAVIYLLNYVYYLDAYFVHLSKHDSKCWEYGYKQIVGTVTPIQSNYETIKVQQSYAQPYIYFLFYQKYSPAKYQAQAKLKESAVGDVGQVERLDNIYFAPIDWSVNRGEKGSLFVADTIRIPVEDSSDPEQFKLIKEINYLNTNPAFRIIEPL